MNRNGSLRVPFTQTFALGQQVGSRMPLPLCEQDGQMPPAVASPIVNEKTMPILVAVAVFLLLAFLVWGSLSALKRRRLLEDLPTSKTAGVFIGLVELKGTAETASPLQSFLAGERCVWFSWTVQEHWSRTVTETYRDSKGKTQTRTRTESGWSTVASGGDAASFYLQDDLGVVRIDPAKAEIHAAGIFNKTVTSGDALYYGKGPAEAIANSTGKRCFSEQAISLHQPVYVVGPARERDDCVATEIAYQAGTPMFMISTSTEESHQSSGLWKFWGLGLLAVLIPVGIGIALVQNETDPRALLGIPAAMGGSVLVVWGIGWLWMVFNSLVGLKNRVKMAAANIDVELKRRFDLIPQLLRVIEGMQKHESQVLETTALLRNQAMVDSLPQDGSRPAKACTQQLIGLTERYPELKTNELFLKLHQNLVETEQRIALARNYYNDVGETHNNRRERFPEKVIAAIAGMSLIPPFQADDFERNRIEINLAE